MTINITAENLLYLYTDKQNEQQNWEFKELQIITGYDC